MRLDTFFEKFDLFADAPDAVVKLRELLTRLAVSGRLVSNRPHEGPVSLKLSGTAEEGSTLPPNWRSGLLGEVFAFEYGENLPATKRSQSGEYPVYGSNGIVGTHDSFLTKEPAIIVGRKGSAGALNVATGPSWTTDVAYFVCPPKELDLRFTYYMFSTLRLDELGKGIKPGLSRKEAYGLPIAIPPLPEQKRIVSKVDDLMALCDRLETQQQERETRHAALARASLARFTDAPTPANLDLLFHKSYSIPSVDLRKSILTLAVQGKLVRQDPNDEPAEVLLQRVDAERAQLVRAKRLRRQEFLGPVPDDAIPFEIPANWQWRYLADICFLITDGAHHTPQYLESGVPFLSVKDVSSGAIDFSNTRHISEEAHRELCKRCNPEQGDILLTKVGTTGIAVTVDDDREFSIFVSLALLKFSQPNLDGRYLKHLINSPFVKQQSANNTQGIGNKNLVLRLINQFTVPIPPLAEQRRIVAKVGELMVLVDAMEAQLATAHNVGSQFVDAVVAELTQGCALA